MRNRACVVYYSRSGHTRALALEVCRRLKSSAVEVACCHELEPQRELGLLQVGAKSITHAAEPVKECEVELEGANLLLLGTPLWGGNPSPYLRSFLKNVDDLKGLHVLLFATCAYGDGNAEEDLRDMIRAKGGRPMEYRVWRIRRDGAEGLSRVAEEVVGSAMGLLPSD